MSFLVSAWDWAKDNTDLHPHTHSGGAMNNAMDLASGHNPHRRRDSAEDSRAAKSLESAANTSSAQDSANSAASSAMTSAYKQQNVIGVDDQPIDPNFHVMRPINILAIKTHPDMAAADVIEMSGGKIGQEQAWDLIQAMISYGGGPSCGPLISSSDYYNILQSVSPYAINTQVALSLATGKSSYPSTPQTKLKSLAPYQTSLMDYMQNRQYKYECRLFNFYADNNKYFSGKITITGRIGMEFGKRLIWFDRRRRYVWEFYLTGVHHSFRYDGNGSGWTTTVTVERGLPFTYREAEELYTNQNTDEYWLRDNDSYNMNGDTINTVGKPIRGDFHKRFEMMWGHAEPFVGGFFGEQTLASMLSQAQERESSYMTKFTGGGSTTSGSKDSDTSSGGVSSVLAAAKYWENKFHGGHYGGSGVSEFESTGVGVCSTFVSAALDKAGYGNMKSLWCPTILSGVQNGGTFGNLKGISASSTGPGDIVVNKDHIMILEEKWHGNSTKVINMGGGKDDINEATYEYSNYSILSDSKAFAEPIK